MRKKINYYLIFLILIFFSKSIAEENLIFLSLKNNEVNLRAGPSFEHPITNNVKNWFRILGNKNINVSKVVRIKFDALIQVF